MSMPRDAAVEPISGRAFIAKKLEPHMEAIANKAIELALGAKKTQLAVSNGVFTDERLVEDNDATLRAQDQVHRLLGNYAQKDHVAPGAITVVINLEGKPAARLSVGQGTTTTGSIDASLTPGRNAVLLRKSAKRKGKPTSAGLT